MSNNTSTVISGTIKELLARGLTFNGVLLDQPAMSVITRLGNGSFCRPIQKISSGKQGKPSTVWEFDANGSFAFAAAAPEVVETVAVETAAVTVDAETLAASNETVTTEVVNEAAAPVAEAAQETVEATATKPQRNRSRGNKAKAETVTAEAAVEAANEMDAPLVAEAA